MAASKTKKRTTSKKSTSAKKQSVSGGFQNEIILLVILAACIILLVSSFGMGGFVGDAISSFSFGAMGLMAYVFPVLLFIGCAFILSNKKNHLAYKKLLAGVILFICFCGIAQLLTEGYTKSTELMDYYALCSDYRTGGGVIGGAVCISITSAFGIVGGYVIIGLAVLVCLIIITQHSFLDFVMGIGTKICDMVRGGQKRYQEGKPERDLKKEVRAQQRRQLKEERRAERIRQLEMELAREDEEETSAGQLKEELFLDPRQARRQMFSLDGTDLTASTAQGTEQASGKKKSRKRKVSGDVEKAVPKEIEALSEEMPSIAPEFEIHRSEPLTDLSREEEESSYEEQVNIMEEDASFSESKEEKIDSKNPKSSPAEIQNGIINIQHEITKQEPAVKPEYKFPPLNLLKKGSGKSQGDSDAHLRKTAQKLQEVLFNFGVNVTVTNVSCGPTVTRYELQPEMGVKVSKIVSLADDIKLNLATPDIRIEAPIPGKAAVGIEVPNKENSAVMLRDLLQSDEFHNAKSKLAFAAGKDIAGKPVVTDIAKMPHLLIAGATGSGKSVCINTLIMSILYKATPDEVKLIMIDPKVVELSVYNGIPHLFIPVVTDPKKAAGALNWAVSEMTTRYNTFAEYGVRNLTEYNKKISSIPVAEGETAPEKMPQIVIIVDELADLMMVAPGEVEDAICRLAQLARAAGIHLIIATQRPSVNVITGLIKANMPSRIAFSVSSGVDSRTILDMNGAEKLLGKGDMLFYPQGYQKPARLQGAFVSDEEVSSVVEFLANKNPAVSYNQQIEQQVNSPLSGGAGGEERDIYFTDAGKFIVEKEKASIGMLQRVFKIGFNRAARIMDQLCDAGVVGPEEGTKPRKVLMTMEEFENYIEESL